MKGYKTIFASNPTATEAAEMEAAELEKIEAAKDAAAEVVFEGFAGIVAKRSLNPTELISDILLHRQSHGSITITEKIMKTSKIPKGTLEKRLVIVATKGEKRTQAVGFRLYLNHELVGERIRTEASARMFGRRKAKGGDVKASAANRFLANWLSPKVRAHGKAMGMAARAYDVLHNDAMHMARAFDNAHIVVVDEIITDPSILEDLVDAMDAAPQRAREIVDGLNTYGYKTKQKIASALGLGGNGKSGDLDRKISAALTIVSNGVVSESKADQVAEAVKVVR